MKKWLGIITFATVAAVTGCFLVFQMAVVAKGNGAEYIQNGIYIGDIDVSGMGREEAAAAVQSYVDGLKEVPLTLKAVGDNTVTVKAGEMGIVWSNQDVLDEALSLGKQGNIVKRYKALKDLERDNKRYEIEFGFDRAALNKVLTEQCTQFDVEV